MNLNLVALLLALVPAALVVSSAGTVAAQDTPVPGPLSPYSKWKNGPSKDPGYFPIAVWLQSPRNAARFKAAGINLFVGLWKGPTSDQLAALEAAGMPVICAQNELALQHLNNPSIVGWMHGDEPDNAQGTPGLRRWGPPIPPASVVRDYERIRASDPSRPVFLNLGQGVAWDNWIGRGVRRNHPEDYPEYLKGCDIASFDIYPVVHDHREVAGKLEFVPKGVTRLLHWSNGERVVWNCVECTHISNPEKKATPEQVRSEVWMSLIHGSRGIIYFVHQFKPEFKEAALLEDPPMLAAVTAINQQIRELAPVLNSPDVRSGVKVTAVSMSSEGRKARGESDMNSSRIAWMQKRIGSETFLFTANVQDEPVRGEFTLDLGTGTKAIEVIGESRTLELQQGSFRDAFKPYEVHLYKIAL